MPTPTRLLAFISLILFSLSLFSQDGLFKVLDPSTTSLTPSANVLFQKYQADTSYQNVWLAEIQSLSSAVTNSQMTIKVPQVTCDFKFDYRDGRQEPGIYSWYGISVDDPTQNQNCSGNEIFYSQDSSGHYGHFIVDDKYFEMMPLEGNYVVLTTAKPVHQARACGTKDGPSNFGPTGNEHKNSFQKTNVCVQEARLRLAILFTPAARDNHPDISALATACVLQSQQILRNSNIGAAELNIQLATIELLDFIESGDIDLDVATWNASSEVEEIRNRTEADLVMVLTEDSYSTDDNIITGVVSGFGPDQTSFTGISILNSALSDKTFVHELGHLLGGRHRDNEPNDVQIIENAHTFEAGFWNVRYGTVIATRAEIIPPLSPRSNIAAQRRILQYSDPDQEFRNENTGVSGDKDVAEFVRQNGVIVSNYIDNGDFFTTLSIEGSWRACPCQSTNYSASVNGNCGEDIGPVSYVWELSYDNVNYTQVSTTPYYTLSPPCGETSYITMRITATTQNNTYVRTRSAYANPNSFGCTSFSPIPTEQGEPNAGFIAYPNPSSIGEDVMLSLPEDIDISQAKIAIYDPLFRVVNIQKYSRLSRGHSRVRLPGSKFSRGMNYIIITYKQGNIEKRKSIIVNTQ